MFCVAATNAAVEPVEAAGGILEDPSSIKIQSPARHYYKKNV
jgi:hypothetical protein